MDLYNYLKKWYENAVPVDIQPTRNFKFNVIYGNKKVPVKVDLGGPNGEDYIDKEFTNLLRTRGHRVPGFGADLKNTALFIKNEDLPVFVSNLIKSLQKAYPEKFQSNNKDNPRQYSFDDTFLGEHPLLVDDDLELMFSSDSNSQNYTLSVTKKRAQKSIGMYKGLLKFKEEKAV